MRQPKIKIDPRPTMTVGDKVLLATHKRPWTVRGVTRGGRFVVLTKPHNPMRTVLYSVIDFDRGVRGRDDHYGLGYESDEQIAAAIHCFQHTEDADPPEVTNECAGWESGDWCIGGADVSFRSANHVRLDIQSVNGTDTDWRGYPHSNDNEAADGGEMEATA